jgi:hypothetical protein
LEALACGLPHAAAASWQVPNASFPFLLLVQKEEPIANKYFILFTPSSCE